MAELKRCYAAQKRQLIDPSQFSGCLFELVVDMITADTFIAGIASKLIDGDSVETPERSIVGRPLFTDGRSWHLRNGEVFEVEGTGEIWRLANVIEETRVACDKALQFVKDP